MQGWALGVTYLCYHHLAMETFAVSSLDTNAGQSRYSA